MRAPQLSMLLKLLNFIMYFADRLGRRLSPVCAAAGGRSKARHCGSVGSRSRGSRPSAVEQNSMSTMNANSIDYRGYISTAVQYSPGWRGPHIIQAVDHCIRTQTASRRLQKRRCLRRHEQRPAITCQADGKSSSPVASERWKQSSLPVFSAATIRRQRAFSLLLIASQTSFVNHQR